MERMRGIDIDRGFGYGGGGGTRGPEAHQMSNAELIAAMAELELEDMIRENPALAQYVRGSAVDDAKRALASLGDRLRKNPAFFEKLLDALRKRSAKLPGEPALFIDPDNPPLVITHTDEGLEGFAPVLGCTLKAIDDLHGIMEGPDIVVAGNDYVDYALDRMDEGKSLISYDPRGISPLDYVALASASFTNETFRFRIQDDQLRPLE